MEELISALRSAADEFDVSSGDALAGDTLAGCVRDVVAALESLTLRCGTCGSNDVIDG